MTDWRALVIDDHENNRRVLAHLLAFQNVEAVEVADPTRVLNFLGKGQPWHLVFVDLAMPDLDGYSVLHTLKARLPRARFIVYSSHHSEIRVARAMGFDGFLGKPLHFDRFPDQLRRIMNGDPVWETT